MIDPWTSDEPDELPFAGAAALLAGTLGVTAGIAVVAAGIVAASWARARLALRR